MKKTLITAMTVLMGTLAVPSIAAPFSVADLLSATKIATDDFAVKNPTHAPHFTGYKAWLSGDESKVKVYVDHNGMPMDFSYLCHNHDAHIECHAQ